ncbi:hypothetical protein AVEN_3895-1 [Araneus ventricosus]|uniref:Uncharacterized protein n=1 Tax=Araneus ventricosus TaxID=182803 RepID=A0A4Y2J925_ARAVE|nr:hypothetical protein AVEN_3895-1 [Araneus ventricosus]
MRTLLLLILRDFCVIRARDILAGFGTSLVQRPGDADSLMRNEEKVRYCESGGYVHLRSGYKRECPEKSLYSLG